MVLCKKGDDITQLDGTGIIVYANKEFTKAVASCWQRVERRVRRRPAPPAEMTTMSIHNDEKTSFSGALGRFGILSEARFYTESRTHYQAHQGRDTRQGDEE